MNRAVSGFEISEQVQDGTRSIKKTGICQTFFMLLFLVI